MKRDRLIACAVVLCLALLPVVSLADGYSGSLPEDLFTRAKEALSLMSYGEYQSAVDTLALKGASATADDLRFFAEFSFSTLHDGVQKTVAVACLSDDYGWLIAVPLCAPDAADVETFVVHSGDGQTLDGYTAASWSFIDDLLGRSREVIWWQKYTPGKKVVVAD